MVGQDPKPVAEDAVPRVAIAVCTFHVLLMVCSGILVVLAYKQIDPIAQFTTLVYVLAFGGIGGTLNASRYVVKSLRYGTYEVRRVPWQILTPLHGAVLAGIGFAVIKGGIISMTQGIKDPATYSFFTMGVSFLIGFSSELFIKRLILASEALFGESHNIEEVGHPAKGERRGS